MKEATQSKKSILLEYLKVIVLTLVITYGVYFIQIKSSNDFNGSYI